LGMVIQAPAKINLWLEVIRKRSDDYHELSSLMLPIGVCDQLKVELRSEEGIIISCDDPELPDDEENLAWKAASLYLKAVGEDRGVRIHLRKLIPLAGGLGGGSSDAAAVLLALNSLLAERLEPALLHDLAAGIGADVPFFLYRKAALATGVGERLEHVEGIPDYPLVLINPPLKVSTAWVYRSLRLTRGVSRIKLRSFLDQPWRLSDVMQNDLEAVTLAEYPALREMKHWLLNQGAIGALMTGSGPTVFGVFSDVDHAARVGRMAGVKWSDCWTGVTQVLSGSPAMSNG